MRKILFTIFMFSFSSSILFAQNTKDSTSADSLLLLQIEQQMQATQPTTQAPAQTRSGANANPNIGLIGDFRTSYASQGKKNFDAYLNETEISVQSVVDPYIRADFYLSFARDPETGKYGVDVEEGYLTTLALPAQLQLKAGKFREAVGRINTIHPHALPFIDMPNAFVNNFGEEGLKDEGFSLSWLVPNKSVYQELIFQATAGYSETPSFARSNGNKFTYLGHLKNFFTLTDNATLELGLTGITGANDSSYTTNIAAADLTYKWKPVQLNTYHSMTWQSEFFFNNYKYATDKSFNSFGLYSYIQYQVSKRWFLTGRYDYAQMPRNRNIVENAFSLTAGRYTTEFQKIEVEVKTTDDNIQSRYYQAWLRWIFVIGAHGAHTY